MANVINFANVPRTSGVAISTANTARDGSGTVGQVIAAGANGSRIDRIRVQAQATTTAGMVRLFLFDGSVYYALQEVPIAESLVAELEQQAATHQFELIPQFLELQGICKTCKDAKAS